MEAVNKYIDRTEGHTTGKDCAELQKARADVAALSAELAKLRAVKSIDDLREKIGSLIDAYEYDASGKSLSDRIVGCYLEETFDETSKAEGSHHLYEWDGETMRERPSLCVRLSPVILKQDEF